MRAIVMTSFAFILGCVPLAIATGPGANSLRAIGTGVIGGMLASTLIAIFFIPLFFWMLEVDERAVREQEAGGRRRHGGAPAGSAAGEAGRGMKQARGTRREARERQHHTAPAAVPPPRLVRGGEKKNSSTPLLPEEGCPRRGRGGGSLPEVFSRASCLAPRARRQPSCLAPRAWRASRLAPRAWLWPQSWPQRSAAPSARTSPSRRSIRRRPGGSSTSRRPKLPIRAGGRRSEIRRSIS